jgi:hypothetical protein
VQTVGRVGIGHIANGPRQEVGPEVGPVKSRPVRVSDVQDVFEVLDEAQRVNIGMSHLKSRQKPQQRCVILKVVSNLSDSVPDFDQTCVSHKSVIPGPEPPPGL